MECLSSSLVFLLYNRNPSAALFEHHPHECKSQKVCSSCLAATSSWGRIRYLHVSRREELEKNFSVLLWRFSFSLCHFLSGLFLCILQVSSFHSLVTKQTHANNSHDRSQERVRLVKDWLLSWIQSLSLSLSLCCVLIRGDYDCILNTSLWDKIDLTTKCLL